MATKSFYEYDQQYDKIFAEIRDFYRAKKRYDVDNKVSEMHDRDYLIEVSKTIVRVLQFELDHLDDPDIK